MLIDGLAWSVRKTGWKSAMQLREDWQDEPVWMTAGAEVKSRKEGRWADVLVANAVKRALRPAGCSSNGPSRRRMTRSKIWAGSGSRWKGMGWVELQDLA